ncbi:Riboflavin transporter RibZ [Dyadobacter sp. CECT 9275]|uniref:Riboflavin transporter RibZ n=2 Tax=Dyadobacter helix TaxID=2822344 RepID=A0A916JHV5_9BACT|nr:Riboflavin transporter RibZ [Dyadobacter sp. CECT 9275]
MLTELAGTFYIIGLNAFVRFLKRTDVPLKQNQNMKANHTGLMSVVSLSVLLASLGTSIVNIALPSLTSYFSASFQSVQWMVIAYLLAITVFVTIAGKLADRYGNREVLLAGMVMYTTSSFLSAFAQDIWVLIVLRGFQGLGAAVLSTVSMAMVKNSKDKVKIGAAMGLLGTMSALGTAMGPSLGGLLLVYFSWRSIFFLLTFLGVLALMLGVRFLVAEGRTDRKNQPINFAALLLLSVSVGTYALSMTISQKRFTIYTPVLLLLSVFAGWAFFAIQRRSVNPLMDISLTNNKALMSSLFGNFLISSIMMTTLIVGPFFLSFGLGLREATVGLLMTAGPLVSILTGIPSGRIVDKTGTRLTIKISLLLLFAGTLVLAFLPAAWGWQGYISGILLLTPGYQLFQAANNTSVMSAVGDKQGGIVSGILNLSRNIGLVTGASLMGALFTVSAQNAPGAVSKTHSIFFGMQITFLTASVFLLFLLVKVIFKRD